MTEQLDDSDLRKAIRQANSRLEQKSEAERRALIKQAIDQAVAEELAEKRAESEREAYEVREELTRDTRRQEAERARRSAPGTMLLLILLLLILYLVAAATGRPDILGMPRSGTDLEPIGPSTMNDGASITGVNTSAGDIAPLGSGATQFYPVAGQFADYYAQNGGERIFGRAISEPMQVNGRTIQWFERARLEEWPEYAGSAYQIQSGRVGVEFTRNIAFPNQTFFVSQPGLRYFAETQHAVRDPFLQFWEQNGGLDIFGFPISEEVQERLPDGNIYRVQYFERARLEFHQERNQIQVGLLGRGLYLNESRPDIIAPVAPTPVPVQ